MLTYRLFIGFFVTVFLSLLGCSESENINNSPVDSKSSVSSLHKDSGTFEGSAPPMEGIVVEGISVPKIKLGFTRTQVEAAYGEPQWCQSSGIPGNNAFCSFPVEGGGQVDVHYRGADGGPATGSYDDVIFKADWTEEVDGWITTSGVNTTLAKENPEEVLSAYPNAQVTYNQYGSIYRVVDYLKGIEVLWIPDFYTGQIHIRMDIFYPMEEPPLSEKFSHITAINLTAQKIKGKRQIQAFIKVQDEQNQSVPGANVIAQWMLPDGSVQIMEDVTSGSGNAHFELIDVPRGTYTITIDDVVLEGYVFDFESSELNASIYVN